MSIFIWNTEYQVYIANASSIPEAKSLLLSRVEQRLKSSINKYVLHKSTNPDYYKSWANRDWEQELINSYKEEREVFADRDPDIIIKEIEALIFDHYNE